MERYKTKYLLLLSASILALGFARKTALTPVGQDTVTLMRTPDGGIQPQVAVAHVDWQMTGHDMSHVKDWSLPEVRKGVLTAVLLFEGDTWRIDALHNTDTVALPGQGK